MPDRDTGKAVQFLSVDEVLETHTALIARFGGAHGLRDEGLLESALYRPRSGYYKDLTEMAAAMFESLMNNHPFVDGNKRVAFVWPLDEEYSFSSGRVSNHIGV